MKLILGIVIALGTVATASAQCPNCQPQQPAYSQPQPQPGYMIIRQRRGLFGWHSRWVAVPTSWQPVASPPVVFIR